MTTGCRWQASPPPCPRAFESLRTARPDGAGGPGALLRPSRRERIGPSPHSVIHSPCLILDFPGWASFSIFYLLLGTLGTLCLSQRLRASNPSGPLRLCGLCVSNAFCFPPRRAGSRRSSHTVTPLSALVPLCETLPIPLASRRGEAPWVGFHLDQSPLRHRMAPK